MRCLHRYPKTNSNRERGVALPMALICLLVISLLAAGIIICTQSEILTTASYRSTTQARYVAEAGIQNAASWLESNWTPPSFGSNFDTSKFPMEYTGSGSHLPVVLAPDAMGTITDTYHYFDSAKSTAFKAAFTNVALPMPSGVTYTGNYSVAAQLLGAYQSGSIWFSSWKIIAIGTVGNSRVQVVGVVRDIETKTDNSDPLDFKYAVLATGTGCNVINMDGSSGRTNSYDSSLNPSNPTPTLIGTGGDVAANGNISVTSGAKVVGNVYTPFYNVGDYGISSTASGGYSGGKACGTNGVIYAVNEDNSGSQVGCTDTGSRKGSTCPDASSGWYASSYVPGNTLFKQRTYQIPTEYSKIADPVMPNVTPNTSACSGFNGLCSGGSGGGAGCAATIPPSTDYNGNPAGGQMNYGVTNFGSCAVITLQAGVYNFDTLYISNGATIIAPTNGAAVINILNASGSSVPLNVDGGTVSNQGGDPANLEMVYAGDKTINLGAGNAMFGTIYAPDAKVLFSGDAGLYGAVVAKTFSFTGSGHVYYDKHLANATLHFPVTGSEPARAPFHIDQFSWSVY